MSHDERRKRRQRMANLAVKHGAAHVAKQFGVSVGWVYSACSENGVVARRSYPGLPTAYAVIADFCRGVLSEPQIATKHGCSRQAVNQVKFKMLRHGIPVHSRYARRKVAS